MGNTRINKVDWIDIVKGIAILFVVLGHSFGGPHYESLYGRMIYWFHMPVFFVVGGVLFKPVNNWSDLPNWIRKKALRIFIPYIIYLCAMMVYHLVESYMLGKFNKEWAIRELLHAVFGGQYLPSPAGPLWFITCLLFTQIIFALICLIFKTTQLRILVVFLLFFLAHIHAWYLYKITLPLYFEISLLTVAYFSFGYYIKGMCLNKTFLLCCNLLTLAFIFLNHTGKMVFEFEIWGHHYVNFLYDLIIPLALSGSSIYVSKLISDHAFRHLKNTLIFLGTFSLPIMCLHSWINIFLWNFFRYGSLTFFVVGTLGSCLFVLIIKRFSFSRHLI